MFKKVYSTKINVIANFVGNIWIALLSIVFVPIYLYYIGVESYGLIGFFSSIQAFITLLDFGLSPTLNRELARLSALEDRTQEMHNVKRTLEIPNWICAVFIALSDFQPALTGEYFSVADNLSVSDLKRLLAETASEIAFFK